MDKHFCQIPCGAMPIILETNYGRAMRPVFHLDRITKFHVLIYVIDGEMQVVEDGIVYNITKDTAFFLKSGVHHWGEKAFEIGTSWYYIHFQFPEFIHDDSIIILPKMINFTNKALKYRVKQIEQNHNSGNVLRASILLWGVLLDCFEAEKNKDLLFQENLKVKKLKNFLSEHFSEKSIRTLVQSEFGVSYKYLSQLLKENTGQTIKQFQSSARLKKAVEYLCETSMSIAEISCKTGFYDEFYFSKIFKREYGVPPSKYRAAYTPRI